MTFRVLITGIVLPSCKEYLISQGHEVFQASDVSEKNICKLIIESDAVIARGLTVTKNIIDSAKKLKIIARFGVGIDMIDVLYAEKKGIWVSNTPLASYTSVAEHTIALILSCSKNIVTSCNQVKNNNWLYRDSLNNFEIKDKTLGLIGLGKVGAYTAKMAQSLGMKIIGYDPFVNTTSKSLENVYLSSNLEDVLAEADFVSLHCPSTAKTKYLINKNTLSLMKKGSYLINTARGSLVDEGDLYDFLKSGKLGGAGIDVMCIEPPLKNNPLIYLDNVIITPHSAAITSEAMHNMGMHAAWCVNDVLTGKPPRWPVNNPINS